MTAGPSTWDVSIVSFEIIFMLILGNFTAVGIAILSLAEKSRKTVVDGMLFESTILFVTVLAVYLILLFPPTDSAPAYYFLLTAKTNTLIFLVFALLYFATGFALIIKADESSVSAKKLYNAWACLNFAVALFYIASLVLSFVLV